MVKHDSVRIVVGDELGYTRCAQSADSTATAFSVVARWGQGARAAGVERLSTAHGNDEEPSSWVAVARANGVVETLDSITGVSRGALDGCGSGDVPWTDAETDASALASQQHFHSLPRPAFARALSRQRGSQAGAFRIHDSAPSDDDTCSWQEHAAWSCAAGVTTFAASSEGSHCCVGWAGKEIAIYDVATHQAVHIAKPPPKDWLGMYVRIVCASSAFVAGATVAGTQVLVGGDHSLRLFDFRAQRRAVRLMALGDKGVVTAVAAHTDGATAAAGNARGQMLHFDLGTGKCLGAFKGCTGAVKAMAMHPSLPLVVATGLDRHVRVYSTANRSQLAAVYVKQACTGVAFCPHGDGGWASRALPPPPPLPLHVDAGEEAHRDAPGNADAGGKPRKRKDKRTTAMLETMSRGAARMLAGETQPPARRVKKLRAAKPQDMQLGITYDDE